MKRLNLLFPTAIAALLLATASGCNKKAKTSDETNPGTSDTLIVEKVSYTDSAATDSGSSVRASVTLDFPVDGPANLVDSVRAWMTRQLSNIGYGTNTTPYAEAASDNTDGQRLAARVAKCAVKGGLTELKGMDGEAWGDIQLQYEYDWTLSLLASTPTYATFGANTYAYLAGAHGSTFFTGQTFGLDGREFDWNNTIAEGTKGRLMPLIREGLMRQYFDVETAQEFKDALLIDPDTLPLPVTPPYFMPDGFHVVYQQYEIACYAAGLPGCVLPYDSVAPLLTPAAKAQLNK